MYKKILIPFVKNGFKYFVALLANLALIKAGKCRTNPWPAVPDWPWCQNANAGLTKLTIGKSANAGLTFSPVFLHLLIAAEVSWFSSLLVYLALKKPPELNSTILSYSVSCWAMRLWTMKQPPKLCCILLSNAIPFWAILHSYEPGCTLKSYSVSYWATVVGKVTSFVND